jgi:glyceraldehyde 3-phosphate dehydrogenase
MKPKVAINGMGRIGKLFLQQAWGNEAFDLVGVNDPHDRHQTAHLLRYDSVYGEWDRDVKVSGDNLTIDGEELPFVGTRDLSDLPWSKWGVDIVVETTGVFRTRDTLQGHLDSGAKKVVLSAPAKDDLDLVVVMGVNDEDYSHANHVLISNASCTTNCMAPVAKVLNDSFGIERGLMTTIHSYTNDQNTVDGFHKDLRRARTAAQNIIPTTTGAAKAVTQVIPELKGKLNGLALRVPTPVVSITDMVFNLGKKVSAEDVNGALTKAAKGDLKGILEVSMEPLVSSDYKGCEYSSVVDGLSTQVVGPSTSSGVSIGGSMVKVLSWYDNEWGYVRRLLDFVELMSKEWK